MANRANVQPTSGDCTITVAEHCKDMATTDDTSQQSTQPSPQLKVYRVSVAADITASTDEEAHETARQLAREIQSADAYIDEIVDENWNEI